MNFKCRRCGTPVEGREYHAECFELMYQEDQLLQKAQRKQRAKRLSDVLVKAWEEAVPETDPWSDAIGNRVFEDVQLKR